MVTTLANPIHPKRLLADSLFLQALFLSLICYSNCVSFQSLYNRQLKSSYGFQILKYYHNEQFGNQSVKKFKGESIIFMAPWRESGIQLSVKYAGKFDYFAPCYYDLKAKRRDGEDVLMETQSQYSVQYLERIKASNPNIKITPRIYVHGMEGDVFLYSSTNETHHSRMMSHITEVLDNSFYDGIIFASPFAMPNNKFPFSMKNILKQIKQIAHSKGKTLFLMLDGMGDKGDLTVNRKKLRDIIDQVDKVIICNYDYPRGNQGLNIPISPVGWIQENLNFYSEVYSKKKLMPKLIMAIPLYGYFVAMYGKYDPIIGHQFLEKISRQKSAYLEWNDYNKECTVVLSKLEYCYFPCLHFLNERLRMFEEWNVGVAAFEIGSGLEIFMQMF